MKTLVICFTSFLLSSLNAFSQHENDIVGKWLNGLGNEKIEIYKKDNRFFGKLIWLKNPLDVKNEPIKDVNNKDSHLQTRPLIGIDIFRNIVYSRNNIWRGGRVYDPKSGRTYNCQIALRDSNKLNVRRYYGIAILGRTETWTRDE